MAKKVKKKRQTIEINDQFKKLYPQPICNMLEVLCWGGNLRNVEPHFFVEEAPIGTMYFWLEPFLLEQYLDESEELKKQLKKDIKALEKDPTKTEFPETAKIIYNIFAKRYLTEIAKRFYAKLNLTTEYVIAKQIAQDKYPEWSEEPVFD